jgi:hypothetical protein
VANFVLLGLSLLVGHRLLVGWAGLLLFAQFSYIGLGVVLNGFSWQKVGRLILSPGYLIWLCLVSLFGMAGFRSNQWNRTDRS